MAKRKSKVSFLTPDHCQFRGVGQGMKQTYLYLLKVALNTITQTYFKWKDCPK
jgi:hypothetical protein